MAAYSALAHGPELVADDPSGAPPGANCGNPGATADARRSGGAAAAPNPRETAPAPADALRAAAHADPTRAHPEAGFVVRVHGESASATVILPHPEQRDLLHVRWNTSIRQTSTISLTDVASVVTRHPKRLRVSTTANHTDPTANDRIAITVDNRPAPTNVSQTGPTTDASTSSAADVKTAPPPPMAESTPQPKTAETPLPATMPTPLPKAVPTPPPTTTPALAPAARSMSVLKPPATTPAPALAPAPPEAPLIHRAPTGPCPRQPTPCALLPTPTPPELARRRVS